MTPKEARQRLYEDYKFYARHAIKIRTKDNDVRPMIFNAPQNKLHEAIEKQYQETGKVRIIILKARQQGFSTYVQGRNYWKISQNKARKGLVVAHKNDSSRTLFDMYRRTHKELPEVLRPSTKYSSRKELVFDKLDSGIIIATAGGDGIARGDTFSDAHLSEIGFWPSATAEENLNALLQTVPNTDDTSIYIESTANGMAGVFYDLWQGAVNGENGFLPFFSPWFDTPEYQEPVWKDFERTLEEQSLVDSYGLTDEQLVWRRRKIAQNGPDKFAQEYPATPEEAFIASGRPVFDPSVVHTMLKSAKPPIYYMAKEGQSFTKHSRGELSVWKDKVLGEEYFIGADVSMGSESGDWSVAQILDSKKRLVASWRGKIHPDAFADVLEALGYYYNNAWVAVENNSHGLWTAVRLGRDLAYPYTWTDISEGQLNDKDTINIGFRMSVKTKPMVIDKLRSAISSGELLIEDRITLSEMLTYIVTESGKYEAEPGCYDDTITSLAICNHIHSGRFTPIKVTDDFYLRAL